MKLTATTKKYMGKSSVKSVDIKEFVRALVNVTQSGKQNGALSDDMIDLANSIMDITIELPEGELPEENSVEIIMLADKLMKAYAQGG